MRKQAMAQGRKEPPKKQISRGGDPASARSVNASNSYDRRRSAPSILACRPPVEQPVHNAQRAHSSASSEPEYDQGQISPYPLGDCVFYGNSVYCSNRDALLDYDISQVVKNKERFWASIREIYRQEKRSFKLHTNFEDADDLNRMYFHVRVHTITGLIEWGTSSTYSIPYWDIQGLALGLKHVCPPEAAHDLLQRNFLESINALTGYLAIAGELLKISKLFVGNINSFRSLGKVTRSDLTSAASRAKEDWASVHERVRQIAEAKYKHLLFLVDQIESERSRMKLLSRLEQLRDFIDLDPLLLNIDIGIDGGLIEGGHRPPYEIYMIDQLRHLNIRSYSTTRESCPIFSHEQILNSIHRHGDRESELINPARDILLPWRFTTYER